MDIMREPLIMLSDMTVNRYKYFRWTPRSARITFVYAVAIPMVLLYCGWRIEVRLVFSYTVVAESLVVDAEEVG